MCKIQTITFNLYILRHLKFVRDNDIHSEVTYDENEM